MHDKQLRSVKRTPKRYRGARDKCTEPEAKSCWYGGVYVTKLSLVCEGSTADPAQEIRGEPASQPAKILLGENVFRVSPLYSILR